MEGSVLGGGVIVMVVAALWLLYLVPGWYQNHRDNVSERDALRLNRALRVLAETSETPQEIRAELNAREVLVQARVARRSLRRRLAKQRQAQRQIERIEDEQQRQQRLSEKHQAQQLLADAKLMRRAELAKSAAKNRARRLAQGIAVIAGALLLGSLVFYFVGAVALGVISSAGSLSLLALTVWVLRRRAVVLRSQRAVPSAAEASAAVVTSRDAKPAAMPDIELPVSEWTPRKLPRPLSASTGSLSAAVLDAEQERDQTERAARESAYLERNRPPQLRPDQAKQLDPNDDDAVAAHVLELLRNRAAG